MIALTDPLNVIITGVGGQGNVLASRLLATAAVAAGYQVSVGETFGASQRGGAVMSHVRLHPTLRTGPLIPRGKANVIVGLEPLETLRVLADYGNPETTVLASDRPIYPIAVLSGKATYPAVDAIAEALSTLAPATKLLPAVKAAQETGNAKATNVVMLGALAACGALDLPAGRYLEALPLVLKPKLRELNRGAFEAGRRLLATS